MPCLPCNCHCGPGVQGACWLEADSIKAPGGDSRVAWGPVPLALIEGRCVPGPAVPSNHVMT